TLDDDVDGVPAKGGEGAGRVRRHDGLNAGRELGGLLPIEHRIESHAPFRERRMELEKGVGLASVLAGTDDGTLETLGVFGIEDDDDIAAIDGLGNLDGECDALAGLRRTGNACAAV